MLRHKRLLLISMLVLSPFLAYKVWAFFDGSRDGRSDSFSREFSRSVELKDENLDFPLETTAETVGGLLEEKGILLGDHDLLIPDKDTQLSSGMNIEIRRAAKIKILVDGEIKENYTLQNTVGSSIEEAGITLSRLDKVEPDVRVPLQDGQKIIITRIDVEEVVKPQDIDFKTIQKTDDKLGWREKKTQQKGGKGILEIRYRITYKNGKEVSRIVLEKNVTKEPVPEIIVQGTYMKLGNPNKGQATWYAFKGGMYAASTSIPIGGFAKVTNTATGKSIVVEINDVGPFGKGRIIDLDKEAFKKIADLGSGVIGVKVSRILN